eukprot:PhM_4_TR11097/c0_g1_i1/m.42863
MSNRASRRNNNGGNVGVGLWPSFVCLVVPEEVQTVLAAQCPALQSVVARHVGLVDRDTQCCSDHHISLTRNWMLQKYEFTQLVAEVARVAKSTERFYVSLSQHLRLLRGERHHEEDNVNNNNNKLFVVACVDPAIGCTEILQLIDRFDDFATRTMGASSTYYEERCPHVSLLTVETRDIDATEEALSGLVMSSNGNAQQAQQVLMTLPNGDLAFEVREVMLRNGDGNIMRFPLADAVGEK